MNEIAIATVPLQSWEQPWEPAKALKEGTVFPSLYKPFYIVEKMPSSQAMPQSEWESQLKTIQETSFALTDIAMYLDTHPDDKEAFAELSRLKNTRKNLLQSFAANHYPLTQDCEGDWADGPNPWDNNPWDHHSNPATKKGGL